MRLRSVEDWLRSASRKLSCDSWAGPAAPAAPFCSASGDRDDALPPVERELRRLGCAESRRRRFGANPCGDVRPDACVEGEEFAGAAWAEDSVLRRLAGEGCLAARPGAALPRCPLLCSLRALAGFCEAMPGLDLTRYGLER